MENSRVLTEYVALVRRLLASSKYPQVAEVGMLGEMTYLVSEQVTQVNLNLLTQLAQAAPSQAGQLRLRQQRDALLPYCDQQLLKTGLTCASRSFEFYIDPLEELVVHLSGFSSLESRPEPPSDASPADQARWIFDHSSVASFEDGKCVVELLLNGRDEAVLSAEELRLLAKGYNWWGRHAKAFETAKLGVAQEPHDRDWLSLAHLYLRNAFAQDLPKYLTACDRCIADRLGPAAIWYLAKADQFLEIAIGERELEHDEWEPGDPIRHPEFLQLAAESLAAALACQPGLREDETSRSWVGNWNERFAAVFQLPKFRHLAQ